MCDISSYLVKQIVHCNTFTIYSHFREIFIIEAVALDELLTCLLRHNCAVPDAPVMAMMFCGYRLSAP